MTVARGTSGPGTAASAVPGTRRNLLREARTVLEPTRLVLAAPRLARIRASSPRAVVTLPGLGASDLSTAPLRTFLASVGHRPLAWELGRHGRDVPSTVAAFVPRARSIAADHDGVALVGWSLGGVVARETARTLNAERPGTVTRVVTYGTPLVGPRGTIVEFAYSADDLDRIDQAIAARRSIDIGCPVVAIHSPNDGIVDGDSCIDPSPGARNVRVGSSHFGMGIDPDVWTAIVDALDD